MRRALVILLFFTLTVHTMLTAQEIYHHVTNRGVYEFIDELAALGLVDVNTSVKPYSRKRISVILSDALEQEGQLNKRQQAELKFYLKDFGKEFFCALFS